MVYSVAGPPKEVWSLKEREETMHSEQPICRRYVGGKQPLFHRGVGKGTQGE